MVLVSVVSSKVSSAYNRSLQFKCSCLGLPCTFGSAFTSWKSTVIKQTKSKGDNGHPCLIPELCFCQSELPKESVDLNLGCAYSDLIAASTFHGVINIQELQVVSTGQLYQMLFPNHGASQLVLFQPLRGSPSCV